MGYFIAFIGGLIVGWQFPQPQWVKDLWAKVKAKISGS